MCRDNIVGLMNCKDVAYRGKSPPQSPWKKGRTDEGIKNAVHRKELLRRRRSRSKGLEEEADDPKEK